MKSLKNIETIADDIKTITIQGATNIAIAAFSVMKLELNTLDFNNLDEFCDFVLKGSKMLMEARDTEPMLFNGMKYALNVMKSEKGRVKSGKISVDELKQKVVEALDEFMGRVEKEKEIRKKIGADLIKDGENIFTHCHSSSAVGIFKKAHKDGKKIHIYNDETRPLYQGRKTSKDLAKAGIPNTMVTDGASTFFVDNIYESHVDIDKVIIGCDSIRINGDVLNKVGSFGIGLAAHHSKIPVYIAGSLMKVDVTNNIEIEKRSANEVWEDKPKNLEILNYAFDMIPAKFITGIITEFGVIKPKDIKKMVKKHYPRMLN
ncbi:MAG TPA: S-methyl-5-thioribose-1-phosphate isomerase [Candidatus Absconditabacterales bacterium]|nr:S-methyl-5-thioribose-1-phosphate isomerase [Candidatus Absconditabacterales bacterium]